MAAGLSRLGPQCDRWMPTGTSSPAACRSTTSRSGGLPCRSRQRRTAWCPRWPLCGRSGRAAGSRCSAQSWTSWCQRCRTCGQKKAVILSKSVKLQNALRFLLLAPQPAASAQQANVEFTKPVATIFQDETNKLFFKMSMTLQKRKILDKASSIDVSVAHSRFGAALQGWRYVHSPTKANLYSASRAPSPISTLLRPPNM